MTWADLIAHAKAERKAFLVRATNARKDWLQARRERRWLDAITYKDRETEYRRSADSRLAFIKENEGKV